jgi:hypothetical protein
MIARAPTHAPVHESSCTCPYQKKSTHEFASLALSMHGLCFHRLLLANIQSYGLFTYYAKFAPQLSFIKYSPLNKDERMSLTHVAQDEQPPDAFGGRSWQDAALNLDPDSQASSQ